MYNKFQFASKYINYYLTASNGKGHGVHSPFVFEFITKVLNDDRDYYCYEAIETLRRQLMQDETVLSIEDFGAGSRLNLQQQRTVASIASSSLKPKKIAQLFFRMVNFYQPKNILELGTSLGITTAYLAFANTNNPVVTMEGSKEIAAAAQKNFDALHLSNIKIVQGNFDETLAPSINNQLSAISFVFIDGNHRKEPTIKYFEQLLLKTNKHSILIFDDVHWSKEMEEAWEFIKAHPAVTLTIDLFFIGVVFFRKEQKEKEHFTIRF